MPRSITTPIKSFRPQRTGNRSTSAVYRGILEHISDYSTSSDPINILVALPPIPYIDWSFYDEDKHIGKMYALDIHSVYTAEINKVTSNTRNSRHYDTSDHYAMCGLTVDTFD